MWYVCMHVCVCVCTCVYVRMRALALSYVFATPQTAACQAPLSMEFYRQEYWSELPLPPPGDLPNPEMELLSFASPALANGFVTIMPPEKPC